VLRCVLIVCASSGLLTQSPRAQTGVVSWPPLSQLSASSLYTEWAATPLSPRLLALEAPDTVPKQIRPTHWKEGGIVGAVALGAFGIWFGHELCTESEAGNDSGCMPKSVIGGAVGGGILGFLIGALIGGQFPKHPPSAPAEPS
jgi:hypothetical protein